MREVLWAVSDLHLGGSSSNHRDFADFLDWASEQEEFAVQGCSRAVTRPTRLILLGDILELWDPVDDSYRSVAMHAAESLKGVLSLADEILYVTGNHDEALEAFEGVYPMSDPRFRIVPRLDRSKAYDQSEDPRYMEVGGKRYFFIHGHEFDRLFLFLGRLSRIPAVMASLNDALKGIVALDGWALPIALAVYAALKSFAPVPSWPLYLLALLSLPRLFTYLQGPFWKAFGRFLVDRPRYRDMAALVEKRYYDPARDTIAADFVVYGHTHVPEVSAPELSKRLGKIFINSGSWVSDVPPAQRNTLVVIDEKGPMLLRWEGRERGFTLLGMPVGEWC